MLGYFEKKYVEEGIHLIDNKIDSTDLLAKRKESRNEDNRPGTDLRLDQESALT